MNKSQVYKTYKKVLRFTLKNSILVYHYVSGFNPCHTSLELMDICISDRIPTCKNFLKIVGKVLTIKMSPQADWISIVVYLTSN
jgi:regulator of RNase E activity RraA